MARVWYWALSKTQGPCAHSPRSNRAHDLPAHGWPLALFMPSCAPGIGSCRVARAGCASATSPAAIRVAAATSAAEPMAVQVTLLAEHAEDAPPDVVVDQVEPFARVAGPDAVAQRFSTALSIVPTKRRMSASTTKQRPRPTSLRSLCSAPSPVVGRRVGPGLCRDGPTVVACPALDPAEVLRRAVRGRSLLPAPRRGLVQRTPWWDEACGRRPLQAPRSRAGQGSTAGCPADGDDFGGAPAGTVGPIRV